MPSINKTAKPPEKETAAVSLMRATIMLMNELIEVMNLEIDLVTNRKLEEHKDLLKKKQRLTMDYRSNMKSIAVQPALMKQLPEDVVVAARTAAQKLAEMSDRNAKFLRGAVVATQRLIQNIVAIVKQEVLPKSGYTNPGASKVGAGLYSPICNPVAVTRTV